MNNKPLLFFCLIGFFAQNVYGQAKIDCDLINLTDLTLQKSPLIQQNELEIGRAEANLQIQSSAFDYHLNSGVSMNHNQSNLFRADPRNELFDGSLKSNYADLSGVLQKRLRSGMTTSVGINHTRFADNFPLNAFSQNVGAYMPDHNTSATLSLTQPLARGKGNRVATAAEKASSILVESANYDFLLKSSYELLQMGTAYWQYLTAYERLVIFEENENRVKNLLDITEQLVQGDKKPASDLIQIMADLADQQRQTIIAKQNLHNARINLGRVVGLSEHESLQMSVPLNKFPSIEASGYNETLDMETLISIARNKRTDILSFQKIQEALELQQDLAKNDLKPQVDLTGFMNYGGMAMGRGIDHMFAPLVNREGRDFTTGLKLNFTFPLNNNLALGTFSQRKLALSEQEIAYNNLLRNVDLNVSIALNNLVNSALTLKKAEESFNNFKQVFENETVKFQNGITTLLNLILFQERLTFSQLDYLQAQQQFAVSIINLRFETGTLFSSSSDSAPPTIGIDSYYVLPGVK